MLYYRTDCESVCSKKNNQNIIRETKAVEVAVATETHSLPEKSIGGTNPSS